MDLSTTEPVTGPDRSSLGRVPALPLLDRRATGYATARSGQAQAGGVAALYPQLP